MSIVITLLQRDAVLRSIGATNSKLYEVLSDYMCGEVYIKSKIEKKNYGFVYDKRVLFEDLSTLPFGY